MKKKNYNAHFVGKLRISFLFLNIKLIYLPIIFDVTLLSALSKFSHYRLDLC